MPVFIRPGEWRLTYGDEKNSRLAAFCLQYGLYALHIKNLKTENLVFKLREKDAREEIVLIDVNS